MKNENPIILAYNLGSVDRTFRGELKVFKVILQQIRLVFAVWQLSIRPFSLFVVPTTRDGLLYLWLYDTSGNAKGDTLVSPSDGAWALGLVFLALF